MTNNFDIERAEDISKMAEDDFFREQSLEWMKLANSHRYSYHFEWLGRPIIQYPQDIMAIQEIIWETKPQLIIETGVAHGGSLILSASLLALLDLLDLVKGFESSRPRKVIGIDIDIRQHNREAIEKHPLSSRIELIQGSSTNRSIVDRVKSTAEQYDSVMVILDSNHTSEHVAEELKLYESFVTKGNYLVVFDTIIEFFPEETYSDRGWGVGNNPMTAVREFLSNSDTFVANRKIDSKLQISVAPGGYLKRI